MGTNKNIDFFFIIIRIFSFHLDVFNFSFFSFSLCEDVYVPA